MTVKTAVVFFRFGFDSGRSAGRFSQLTWTVSWDLMASSRGALYYFYLRLQKTINVLFAVFLQLCCSKTRRLFFLLHRALLH